MKLALIAAVAVVPVALTFAACGGDSGPEPEGTSCFDYGSFAPQTGMAYGDVLAVFQARSCTSESCHGSQTSPEANLYLGPKSGDVGAAEAESIVNGMVREAERSTANVVEPGAPEQSFLMAKLESDPADACGMSCRDGMGCGDAMPQGGTPLSPADLDVVRSWIALGAPAQ